MAELLLAWNRLEHLLLDKEALMALTQLPLFFDDLRKNVVFDSNTM